MYLVCYRKVVTVINGFFYTMKVFVLETSGQLLFSIASHGTFYYVKDYSKEVFSLSKKYWHYLMQQRLISKHALP